MLAALVTCAALGFAPGALVMPARGPAIASPLLVLQPQLRRCSPPTSKAVGIAAKKLAAKGTAKKAAVSGAGLGGAVAGFTAWVAANRVAAVTIVAIGWWRWKKYQAYCEEQEACEVPQWNSFGDLFGALAGASVEVASTVLGNEDDAPKKKKKKGRFA